MTRPSPDPQGRDEDFLEQSETLDEDELDTDPLERGRDPAEGWSAADRYGTTASEQATTRPVSDRLAEERPDTGEGSDTEVTTMQRGSDKHGARHDDALAAEVDGMIRGTGPTRAEEWHDPEPPADDDPDVSPGTPSSDRPDRPAPRRGNR